MRRMSLRASSNGQAFEARAASMRAADGILTFLSKSSGADERGGHSREATPDVNRQAPQRPGRRGRGRAPRAMLGLEPMEGPPNEIVEGEPSGEADQTIIERQKRRRPNEAKESAPPQSHNRRRQDGDEAGGQNGDCHRAQSPWNWRARSEQIAGQAAPQRVSREKRPEHRPDNRARHERGGAPCPQRADFARDLRRIARMDEGGLQPALMPAPALRQPLCKPRRRLFMRIRVERRDADAESGE